MAKSKTKNSEKEGTSGSSLPQSNQSTNAEGNPSPSAKKKKQQPAKGQEGFEITFETNEVKKSQQKEKDPKEKASTTTPEPKKEEVGKPRERRGSRKEKISS